VDTRDALIIVRTKNGGAKYNRSGGIVNYSIADRCFLCYRIAPAAGLSFVVMPTYDYSCEKCGGSLEIRQSMKDSHLTECPQDLCRMTKWGHGKLKRQMGAGAGLIFKGSGFYITDYRSEGYKQAAQKESTAAAPPAAAGGGDSATATPTPAKTTPPTASPTRSEKTDKSAKPRKKSGSD
jgi:putative FmdB family regulatory protein